MAVKKFANFPTTTYLISALCVVVLLITLAVMATTERVSKPQNINGDVLGPEQSELITDYVARADQSLADAASASAKLEQDDTDAPRPRFWALVTFAEPGYAEPVAAAVSDVYGLRVASMVVGSVVTRDLPEPTLGEGRLEVINREMSHLLDSSGLTPTAPEMQITGLVVYGDISMLETIRDREQVAAVEPLAHDAVRGRFGVRTRLPILPPAEAPDSAAVEGVAHE